MRRRFAVALAASVLGAVVLVGAGTLVLARADARERATEDLAATVRDIARALGRTPPAPARLPRLANDLAVVADLDSLSVVTAEEAAAALGGADLADVPVGEARASLDGNRAVATTPLPNGRWLLARQGVDAGVGRAGRWFVVAGAVTVVLGAGVGWRLARSITGRLAGIGSAAGAIAGGDLSTRVGAAPVGGDELDRLAASLNAMADGLQRADQQERQFLLAVSHDLRTPLTSIRGWAEAIVDGAAPDPKAAAQTVLAEAARLQRLVDDLLELARLRARSFTWHRGPVDLGDAARRAVEAHRPDLVAAGLALDLDAPAAPVMVAVDGDRVAQIAANLLDNAGRYAASAVRVVVTTAGTLVVEDDGPGLPAGEPGVDPDRFGATARPPARGVSGAGIGLAIVRELAEAMGGEVQFGTADAGGARAEVTLPLWHSVSRQ